MRNILGFAMYGMLFASIVGFMAVDKSRSQPIDNDRLTDLSFWEPTNQNIEKLERVQHTWGTGLPKINGTGIPRLGSDELFYIEDTRNQCVTNNLKGTTR